LFVFVDRGPSRLLDAAAVHVYTPCSNSTSCDCNLTSVLSAFLYCWNSHASAHSHARAVQAVLSVFKRPIAVSSPLRSSTTQPSANRTSSEGPSAAKQTKSHPASKDPAAGFSSTTRASSTPSSSESKRTAPPPQAASVDPQLPSDWTLSLTSNLHEAVANIKQPDCRCDPDTERLIVFEQDDFQLFVSAALKREWLTCWRQRQHFVRRVIKEVRHVGTLLCDLLRRRQLHLGAKICFTSTDKNPFGFSLYSKGHVNSIVINLRPLLNGPREFTKLEIGLYVFKSLCHLGSHLLLQTHGSVMSLLPAIQDVVQFGLLLLLTQSKATNA